MTLAVCFISPSVGRPSRRGVDSRGAVAPPQGPLWAQRPSRAPARGVGCDYSTHRIITPIGGTWSGPTGTWHNRPLPGTRLASADATLAAQLTRLRLPVVEQPAPTFADGAAHQLSELVLGSTWSPRSGRANVPTVHAHGMETDRANNTQSRGRWLFCATFHALCTIPSALIRSLQHVRKHASS